MSKNGFIILRAACNIARVVSRGKDDPGVPCTKNRVHLLNPKAVKLL